MADSGPSRTISPTAGLVCLDREPHIGPQRSQRSTTICRTCGRLAQWTAGDAASTPFLYISGLCARRPQQLLGTWPALPSGVSLGFVRAASNGCWWPPSAPKRCTDYEPHREPALVPAPHSRSAACLKVCCSARSWLLAVGLILGWPAREMPNKATAAKPGPGGCKLSCTTCSQAW